MNPNQLSNPQTQANESNFNTEATAAEKESRFRSLGHRVLGIVKGVFSKEHQPKSKNYLLMEHLPKDFRKANKDICKGWDECGVDMPAELGESLEMFINDPDYWIGVHRSGWIDGAAFEHDDILQSIMEDGLINLGDSSSGAIRKNSAVSKTLSHCNNMLNTTIYLKSSYKGSTGAVLVAIPSKYLTDDGDIKPGFESAVYDYDKNGMSRIKPEFMMGFVQNLGPGHKLEFKTRDEILAAKHSGEEK